MWLNFNNYSVILGEYSVPNWLRRSVKLCYSSSETYLFYMDKFDGIYLKNVKVTFKFIPMNDTFAKVIMEVYSKNNKVMSGEALVNLKTREVYDKNGRLIGTTCLWLPVEVLRSNSEIVPGKILNSYIRAGKLVHNVSYVLGDKVYEVYIYKPKVEQTYPIYINFETLTINSRGKYWRVLTIINGVQAYEIFYWRMDHQDLKSSCELHIKGYGVIKGMKSVGLISCRIPYLSEDRYKYFIKVEREIFMCNNSSSRLELFRRFLANNPDIKEALEKTKYAVIVVFLNDIDYEIKIAQIGEKCGYCYLYGSGVLIGEIPYHAKTGIALILPHNDAIYIVALNIRGIAGNMRLTTDLNNI